MASGGIASILLPKGVTSHKTFKLPFNFTSTVISNMTDSHKKSLRESDVIVWDKASIIPKKELEIVDKTSRNVCNIDQLPFAEKLIILCKDYRQILSVVKNGTKFNSINETIKFSYIWHQFCVMKLKKNICVHVIKIFQNFYRKLEKVL